MVDLDISGSQLVCLLVMGQLNSVKCGILEFALNILKQEMRKRKLEAELLSDSSTGSENKNKISGNVRGRIRNKFG